MEYFGILRQMWRRRVIDQYIKSLEKIANEEKDSRHEKAQKLRDNYKKGTYHLARAWEKGRSKRQVQCYQQTFLEAEL